jgi:hypothetical protein
MVRTLASTAPAGTGQVQRLLVVVNETLAGDSMVEAVGELAAPGASVFIVCPTLVSRARLWTSDLTAGMVAARHRLSQSVSHLRASGLEADGMVGDTDPVLAIDDALCLFPAEHLLLCVHAPMHSSRYERRMLERALDRFSLAQSHVVVDLAADSRIVAHAPRLRVRAPA